MSAGDDIDEYLAQENSGNNNAWLMTFADLLSLMLTFFVLLYSMSVISNAQWEELSKSLQKTLNPERETIEMTISQDDAITSVSHMFATDLDYLNTIIQDKITSDKVVVKKLDDRMIISLSSDLLFASGSATPSYKGMETIMMVADVIKSVNNRIEINGHTDPTPIKKGAKYSTNRELSLARALAIASFISEAGYFYPVHAFGFADSRFDEISTNLTKIKRQNLGRRVDIVIRGTIP